MGLRKRWVRIPFYLHPLVLTIIGAILGLGLASFLSSRQSCAHDSQQCRIISELVVQPTIQYLHPPTLVVKSSRLMFQDRPFQRTYYAECQKNCHATIRAFRELGWTKVNQMADASVVHSDNAENLYTKVRPWQRYNHIHNATTWSRKLNMMDGIRRYERQLNHRDTSYFPRYFRLNRGSDQLELQRLAALPQWKNAAWSWLKNAGDNRTRSIVPTRKLDLAVQFSRSNRSTVEHIPSCRPLTWSDGRSLAVRIFWMVASTDPLLVLYQDGYARIGFDEAFPKWIEDDPLQVSFDGLSKFITKHGKSRWMLRGLDPMEHIKNQFKEATSIFVDMFKDTTFKSIRSRDAYEVYAFDFTLDHNLDVYLLDTYTDKYETGDHRPLMNEDFYFLLEKNHELYYGMTLVLEDVWDKQSRGANILPLRSTGKFQLIHAGESWRYEYDGYKRSHTIKNCKLS